MREHFQRRLSQTAILALAFGLAPAGGNSASMGVTSQSLNALIYPVAKLSAPVTVTMTSGANRFDAFQAVVPIGFRARTSIAGGGTITLQITSDFSPAGGPSAAAGALQYSCSGASLGTPCSGIQTATPNSQTPVLALPAAACTGGGGACSAGDSNSLNLNFTLADDASYATGSYSAQLTFIISAT